jgi:hypothetical protein
MEERHYDLISARSLEGADGETSRVRLVLCMAFNISKAELDLRCDENCWGCFVAAWIPGKVRSVRTIVLILLADPVDPVPAREYPR